MLFELRRQCALDRPMAAVMHPRREFVDQRPVDGGEKLDGQHADMAERLGDAGGDGAGFLGLVRDKAACGNR